MWWHTRTHTPWTDTPPSAEATAGQSHMHVTDDLGGREAKVRVYLLFKLEDQQDPYAQTHTHSSVSFFSFCTSHSHFSVSKIEKYKLFKSLNSF